MVEHTLHMRIGLAKHTGMLHGPMHEGKRPATLLETGSG
jgi:hypothetical protein